MTNSAPHDETAEEAPETAAPRQTGPLHARVESDGATEAEASPADVAAADAADETTETPAAPDADGQDGEVEGDDLRHTMPLTPKQVRAKNPLPWLSLMPWNDQDVPAAQFRKRKAKAKRTPVINVLDRINMNFSLGTLIYALCCIVSVCLAYFCMEYVWHPTFTSDMTKIILLKNLFIVADVFVIFHCLCLRTRGSLIAFPVIGYLWGTVNHYVLAFKGFVFTPADIFAAFTAADVAGAYDYTPSFEMILAAILVIAFAVCVILFCPRRTIRPLSSLISLGVAAVLLAYSAFLFATVDLQEASEMSVDDWNVNNTYSEYGTPLTFAVQAQQIHPEEPEGYSSDEVHDLLKPYPDEAEEFEGTVIEAYEAAGYTAPTVVTVMNETFSDLSQFESLTGTVAELPLYSMIASDAKVSGTAFVGVMGGGTCNSEMEYLTGCSLANIGDENTYPYVIYDLSRTGSLAHELKAQGYATSAMHPAPASNWNRSVVYDTLGFDRFYSIDDFEGAEKTREFVTDKGTYEKVLEVLKATEDPQFIFDVTIQNHSPYLTGEIDPEDMFQVEAPTWGSGEVNEFVSLMHRSEEDLLFLVEELDKVDRPIVLTFFGDHQPFFSMYLWSGLHDDIEFSEADLQSSQVGYNVPFMIWENRAQREQRAAMELAGWAPFEAPEYSVDPAIDGVSAQAIREGFRVSEEVDLNERSGGMIGVIEEEEPTAEELEPGFITVPDLILDNNQFSYRFSDRAGEYASREHLPANGIHDTVLSLNYLGGYTLGVAGLPQTQYRLFMDDMHEVVPAITSHGYMTDDGLWHTMYEDTPVSKWIADYRVLQFHQMFG